MTTILPGFPLHALPKAIRLANELKYCRAVRGPDIRLMCGPYQESLCDMPQSDLEAEDGSWAGQAEFVELFGGDPRRQFVVARFVPVALEAEDRGKESKR